MLSTQTNEFVCFTLLMHVHLGEETCSHRDLDESGFPTNSQNHTLLEAELTHPALNCQCLLQNGVGSEKSIPVDPQISIVADESHRQRLSQFQMPVNVILSSFHVHH